MFNPNNYTNDNGEYQQALAGRHQQYSDMLGRLQSDARQRKNELINNIDEKAQAQGKRVMEGIELGEGGPIIKAVVGHTIGRVVNPYLRPAVEGVSDVGRQLASDAGNVAIKTAGKVGQSALDTGAGLVDKTFQGIGQGMNAAQEAGRRAFGSGAETGLGENAVEMTGGGLSHGGVENFTRTAPTPTIADIPTTDVAEDVATTAASSTAEDTLETVAASNIEDPIGWLAGIAAGVVGVVDAITGSKKEGEDEAHAQAVANAPVAPPPPPPSSAGVGAVSAQPSALVRAY